ncbi:MAG: ArnT family glycosyltransferase [Myxococcota bacterium]
MANESQVPHGPLWGGLAIAAATWGVLMALGSLGHDRTDAVPLAPTLGRLEGEPVWATPRVGVAVAVAVLGLGLALGGVAALPWTLLASSIALLPAALRRPGLLVFVIVTAVYLPQLGAYGLWDPWETHYAEVAREILARDDWISLWWAQEDWFWSKPILIFWSQALSMGAFGVDFQPDANPAHPEWALRLPVFVIALGAVMASYAAASRIFSRRVGVLVALVMATMPHFFLLAHQTITDMPFVGCMTIAMALLALALATDPDRMVRPHRVGPWVVSAQHLVIAALVMVVLPQVLYLVSRNVTLYWPSDVPGAPDPGFAWHADTFTFGSAGNDGVPGNKPVRHGLDPSVPGPWAQPGVQGLVWLAGMAALVWMLARERRTQALLMFGFYFFCALAFMAKGIPGFALPGLVALLYLIASRRWSLLLDGRLRIGWGALGIGVVGLPWYVAMYVRHGPAFTNRLFVHDHINRLTEGVHMDTTMDGSIRYFVLQLGFATFPWVAMLPAAAVGWLWYRRPSAQPAVPQPSVGALRATGNPAWTADDADHRRETILLMAVWAFAAFALFSAMLTKFHHYIFPAIPPAAFLGGVLLDRLWGPRERRVRGVLPVATVLAALAPLPLVLGVAGARGNVRGVLPPEAKGDWVLDHPWPTATTATLVLLGLLMLGAAAWIGRRRAEEDGASDDGPEGMALGTALAAGAVLLAFVGRDLSWATTARPQGYERLIHLFVYNYNRPWPDHLDYRPILTGFAVVATAIVIAASARRLRPMMSRAMLGVALLFSAWAIHVYLIDLSPHWGQRELVKKYYDLRESPDEALIAWQMNWKGENFYTGNRVHAFVDLDNRELREWLGQHRGQSAYFVLEHSRLGSFRGLLRDRPVKELTTKRDNNKFVLVRADL